MNMPIRIKMKPDEREEFAVIKTKVENIEETNKLQNKSLDNLHTKVDKMAECMAKFTEWAKHKDKTDSRQDKSLLSLANDKADKSDMEKLGNKAWTVGWAIVGAIVVGFISAIITKIIGLW